MTPRRTLDRKSTRLNSSHANISYAVFCLKKKNMRDLHLLSEFVLTKPYIPGPRPHSITEKYAPLAQSVSKYDRPVHAVDPFFFFFNETATNEIYTLSLHDALPIRRPCSSRHPKTQASTPDVCSRNGSRPPRSEEHTSELQSRQYLVCRLLLEKKKASIYIRSHMPKIHHRRVKRR